MTSPHFPAPRVLQLVLAVAVLSAGACGARGDAARSVAPTPSQTPAPSSRWSTTVGTTACGVVRAYAAPTATSTGTLDIGSRHYVLAAGTRAPFPTQISIGEAQCLWGGIDAPLGPLGSGVERLDRWRCGRVRAYVPPRATAPGRLDILETWSLGTVSFVVLPGASLASSMPFDSFRCVVPDIDTASGDAIARELSDTLADVDVHCGQVKAWRPPTPSAAGAITIGSRTIDIPSTAAYQRDPAGSPTDTTAIGQVTCFRALLDDRGEVTRYGPHRNLGQPDANGRLLGGECGSRGAAFESPSAGRDGYIAYSLRSAFTRIPAGAPITTIPPCIERQLDASGDVIAPAGRTPGPVRF